MATAYCVQRADLISYHRMLSVWREEQSDPLVKNGIGQWLSVIDTIEAHTKHILVIK